jgi:hypothetical protein
MYEPSHLPSTLPPRPAIPRSRQIASETGVAAGAILPPALLPARAETATPTLPRSALPRMPGEAATKYAAKCNAESLTVGIQRERAMLVKHQIKRIDAVRFAVQLS